MKVGLIQFDILWENVQGNVERVSQMLEEAATQGVDMLVLPELWACGFTMNQEAHKTFQTGFDAMKAMAAQYNCTVVGGLPHKTETGQENRCYLVDGERQLHYAKIKAFKFAGEHLKYEQGTACLRIDVGGFQMSPFVCYDLRFPELARSMVPQTNLFIYVANWPTPRVHHWRQLLIARAIENQAYVIGVNRLGSGGGMDFSGSSMVVDPLGQIVLDAGDAAGVYFADLDPSHVAGVRATFKFLDDM